MPDTPTSVGRIQSEDLKYLSVSFHFWGGGIRGSEVSLILDPVLLRLSVSPLNNLSLTFSISKSDARTSSGSRRKVKELRERYKDKVWKARWKESDKVMGVGQLRVLGTRLEVIRTLLWHKFAGKHARTHTHTHTFSS